MSALADLLMGIFWQPTLGGVALELAAIAAPLWFAALMGLLVGWAWHPRWAVAVIGDHDQAANPPALPPPRATTTTEGSCRHETTMVIVPRAEVPSTPMEDELPVNTRDLMHLRRLVEEKDGGPSWIHVMERTLPTMRCQAWRRDPEVSSPQKCFSSRGVPRPSVPRRNKPHRADLYYSSWCIRPGALVSS